MKWTKILLLLLVFAASTINPTWVRGGIFSSDIVSQGRSNSVVASSTRVTSFDIFERNLGAPNPKRWATLLPSTANAEKFLSSTPWQNTRRDVIRIYGNRPQVNQYLDYQEFVFRREIKINNIASSRSLNVKGNLAESIMDDFFLKDGWEKIDGKRGRNGFDGLYVRRDENGRIKTWIAADAKSGNAKLNVTQHGKQLSPEWVEHNLKELLKDAEQEYSKRPTETNFTRINDLRKILSTKGRIPRVFSSRIEQINGKINVVYRNINLEGKTIGKPMLIDMQSVDPKMLKHQKLFFKNLRECIAEYAPEKASSLTKGIERGLRRGKIKNDSDMYRYLKRNIPDKRLANAVAQQLGEEPPRGSLAGLVGKRALVNTGVLAGYAASAMGLAILQDIFKNGEISSSTFLKAGFVFSASMGVGYALNKTMEYALPQTSEFIAKNALTLMGKKATEKAVSRLAGTIGKSLGVGVVVVSSSVEIGNIIYNYNQSNVSQKDALVNIGLSAATSGAVIGSFFIPGVGTLAGAAIGAGIAFVGGGIQMTYNYLAEQGRQERILFEMKERAKWEVENNEEKRFEMIRKLEAEAAQLRADALQVLPSY